MIYTTKQFISYRYMAIILPMWRKTLYNQTTKQLISSWQIQYVDIMVTLPNSSYHDYITKQLISWLLNRKVHFMLPNNWYFAYTTKQLISCVHYQKVDFMLPNNWYSPYTTKQFIFCLLYQTVVIMCTLLNS